ncbi:metallophosphoesterase [Aestuariibacter sp. GS-14]|uniref:metallophosphoesterase family protein n=1 Tax=Aestuariibacter sp. GS-14 TaxID=2590670 RepID=UPI0015E860C0|nr:metallophosphoesterase [Aestuariibacter sp. GS-14]
MISVFKKTGLLVFICIVLGGCGSYAGKFEQENGSFVPEQSNSQIAFLADIHLHDFVASAQALDSVDLPVIASGTPVLIRSMQAQLHSTRLFNENYFVLRATLDDLAAKGIKLVALPGDFSDDGQPVNITALANLLDDYHKTYGMRFFAINGNHDPVRPFTRAGGKPDFLDNRGEEVAVMSTDHPRCHDGSAWQCSDALREWGYSEITRAMSTHGFMPDASDLYYETPFGTADLSQRGWQWCEAESPDICLFMPDTSYLVEPQKDVWLLAIDANVYEPIGQITQRNFKGSGNAGYNSLVRYKPGLVSWITDVVKRARQQHKRLVAFSHFPMADFYDGTAEELASIFGDSGMQLRRMPTAATTDVLSETGLRLHMAGHMHLYDVYESAKSSGLVNVQVPSLAAWLPGYSLVTLNDDHSATVKTVIQSSVPDFDSLFPLYRTEWAQREASADINWDPDILNSDSYLAFTDAHLRGVVRSRYVGKEWPAELAEFINKYSIGETLKLATGEDITDIASEEILQLPAITFAYDYYRLRNAGQFADLQGREDMYERLGLILSNTSKSQLDTHWQIKQLLMLMAKVVKKRDATEIHVTGV